MFLRRAVPALSRPAALLRPAVSRRSFAISACRLKDDSHAHVPQSAKSLSEMKPFEEVTSEADLLPPGAAPGTIPTDIEQATGLERLEILGKMQGVDIFDMRPLDASRKGTLDNPIVVKGFGDEQYVGCTGSPADSHVTIWLTISRGRPVERCPECGSAYKLEYVGPTDDGHHDHHEHPEGYGEHHPDLGEPKTIADFIRPEYR